MNDAMLGLMWVAAGALAIGLSTVVLAHYSTKLKVAVGGAVCLVAFFIGFLGLALPISIARPIIFHPGPRSAVAGFIQLSGPGRVTCGSAWSELQGPSHMDAEAVQEFDPGYGSCQAAAWQRVASVGGTEFGLAILVGGVALLIARVKRAHPIHAWVSRREA